MFNHLTPRHLLFIFLIACTACFFPLLSLTFYYDDLATIQNNDLLGTFPGFPLFFKGIVDSHHEMNGCYRPLFLSYLSLANFISREPAFLRMLGFFLHSLNVTLLFYILTRFYDLHRVLVFSLCLLFLLHPIHVTSLSLVWKQSDLWIALFTLVTLLLWHQKAPLWKLCLVWIIALLFKESGVILPMLWLLLWLKDRRSYPTLLFILGACVLDYVYLKWLPKLGSAAIINSDGNPFGRLDYFWSQLHIVPQYFLAILNPSDLTLDRSVPTLLNPGIYEYLTAAALFLSCLLALWKLWKRSSPIAFCYLLACLWLLPTSSFQPLSLLYDETRMYLVLPLLLAGGCFALPSTWLKTKPLRYAPLLVFGVLLLTHWTHAHQWNSVENIWRQSVRVNQARGICAARAHFELGRMYEKERALDDAEIEFQRTLSCTQDIPQAWLHLGIIRGQKGDLIRAKEAFDQVPAKEPYWRAQAEYYLGLNAFYDRKYNEATTYFKRAHELSPRQKLCEKGLSILRKRPITTCE